MTAIRGILFDKDGTLLDFAATWPAAYRAAAEALADGTPGLASRLLRRAGYDGEGALDPASALACGTNAEIAALWAAEPALAGRADVAVIMAHVFRAHAAAAPPVVADLAAFFARLRRRGLALGVATNDDAATAEAWLGRTGALAELDFVCGADSGHGAKPGPGMVTAFCAAVGLAPREVAVVGDSAHDLAMARAAGTGLAIAVLTGVAGHARLAPFADLLIPSIADLEAALADRLAGS